MQIIAVGVGVGFCVIEPAWGMLYFGIFFKFLLTDVIVIKVVFALGVQLARGMIVTDVGFVVVIPFTVSWQCLILNLLNKFIVVIHSFDMRLLSVGWDALWVEVAFAFVRVIAWVGCTVSVHIGQFLFYSKGLFLKPLHFRPCGVLVDWIV